MSTTTTLLQIVEVKKVDRQQPRWVSSSGFGRGGYMSPSYREFTSKPRLHVFPKGENVMENLFVGRRNRPIAEYRKLLPAIFEAAGLPADTKANWSQRAGCSCGCSPGFILTLPGGLDNYAFDVFVDVTAADPADAAVTDDAKPALRDLQASVQALKQQASSGRSEAGNLRNFKAMQDAKLHATLAQVIVEDNDPAAVSAIRAELVRRQEV